MQNGVEDEIGVEYVDGDGDEEYYEDGDGDYEDDQEGDDDEMEGDVEESVYLRTGTCHTGFMSSYEIRWKIPAWLPCKPCLTLHWASAALHTMCALTCPAGR